jgi:hypothetical protein
MGTGRLVEMLAGLHESRADPRVGFSDKLRKQTRRLTNACMVPQPSFIFRPEPIQNSANGPEPVVVPSLWHVQRPFADPAGSPEFDARLPR